MLTSRQNSLIKQLRKLQQAKARQEQQLVLLEGTHLLEAACQVRYPLQVVCCTEAWQTKHTSLWEQLHDQADRLGKHCLDIIVKLVDAHGLLPDHFCDLSFAG